MDTTMLDDHAERLRLWLLAADPETLEVEWCGDPDCARCELLEPLPVEEAATVTLAGAPPAAA